MLCYFNFKQQRSVRMPNCNFDFQAIKVSCGPKAYIAVATFRVSESEGECGPWLNLEIQSQIIHTEAKNLRKIKFVVYKYKIVKMFMSATSEFTLFTISVSVPWLLVISLS